ncbi:MAG: nucleotidyl transferase AbiEii/AbiGii toxin family protein [Pirellulales bacterium]|nr:nucleotidyl transferase AbiEii/AbiGii toxin family protein [Pirellulales bacterium]
MPSKESPVEFLNRIKQQVIIAILGDDELGDRLVLKGGNLLQFAYQQTTRASKDVDISVDGEFPDTLALREKVQACLKRALLEIDLVIVDFTFAEVPPRMSEDLKSFWGGYKCEFKLVDRSNYDKLSNNIKNIRKHAHPIDGNGSTRFKVDFSNHEFCEDKEEFEICGYTIYGYSPRMFVAEKLRAICQQMP